MSNSKIDFINDLLSSKKIKIEEKNRILELTKVELMNFDAESDEIKRRINKIENKIKELDGRTEIKAQIDSSSIEQKQNKLSEIPNLTRLKKNEPSNNTLPKYINPFAIKGMARFLKAYNENPILKTTCHEIDDEDIVKGLFEYCKMSEYNFNVHLECIKKEFDKLTKDYKINVKIYSLIKGYIHGGVKWSTDNLEMSWSNLELQNWSIANPKSIPNPGINFVEKNEKEGYNLTNPFTSSMTGKNIITFSDFVLLFKSMFHINSNNPLKKYIIRISEIKKFSEWADIKINENKFGENIHLYTDVDKLIQAYVKLVELIKSINVEFKINERPKIIISFFEQEKDIIFSIHHLNSTFKKSLMSTLNHPFGLSMPPIIENQINGLCNLELKADFGNNDYAKINLWDGSKIKVIERYEQFQGVEYILKFER